LITENGWPSCTRAQCDDVRIPGTQEVLPFQHGIPAIILPAFMACLNQFVESANNSAGYRDEGSWTPTNSVGTSNHLGGTAFDYNWDDHPMGVPLDGWHGSEIIHGEEEPEIRRTLEYFSLVLPSGEKIYLVYWGNDWRSPKDSMHFQMGYGTYENQIAVWQWINEHIDKDGFALYRRTGSGNGGAPVPTADLSQLLGDAMGNVPGVDYDALLPHYVDAMQKAEVNNENRADMFAAQLGHESVGLKYMKEIGDAAYFAQYNNRADLGNGPTDGPRYPGRGPIQVTGRANYRKLSQWAFTNGYVPTATYFEDNPEQLEQYEYAFLGAVWYWTVARPDINSLSDAGDVLTVTKRINGGTNGLADRQNRWDHCKTLDLTPLIEGDDWMADEDIKQLIRDIHRETVTQESPSRSFMSTGGNKIDTPLGIEWNIDGNAWTLVMTEAYRLDVPLAVTVIEDIATNGVNQTSWVGANDFNKWLQDFGQAYCNGLVAEKKAKLTAKVTRPKKSS
jgi:predicted chitinase